MTSQTAVEAARLISRLYHVLEMRELPPIGMLLYLKGLGYRYTEQEIAEILDEALELREAMKRRDELEQIAKIEKYREYRTLPKLLEAVPPVNYPYRRTR